MKQLHLQQLQPGTLLYDCVQMNQWCLLGMNTVRFTKLWQLYIKLVHHEHYSIYPGTKKWLLLVICLYIVTAMNYKLHPVGFQQNLFGGL